MNGYKEMVLSHSAKRHKWKNHKYTSVVIGKNGKKRYVYDRKLASKVARSNDADYRLSSENEALDNEMHRSTYNAQIKSHNVDRDPWALSRGGKRFSDRGNMRRDTTIGKQSSLMAKNQRKASYKAKIKYYAAINKAKKYAKKGKAAVKKFIDKNIKKTFTVNKNQIILPDSGARVTFK